MKHGTLLPVLLQLIYGQTAEQLAPPAEISMERAGQKALPETAGTGQKDILKLTGNVKDVLGLVNIEPGALAYLRECLYAYRIFHAAIHRPVSILLTGVCQFQI